MFSGADPLVAGGYCMLSWLAGLLTLFLSLVGWFGFGAASQAGALCGYMFVLRHWVSHADAAFVCLVGQSLPVHPAITCCRVS